MVLWALTRVALGVLLTSVSVLSRMASAEAKILTTPLSLAAAVLVRLSLSAAPCRATPPMTEVGTLELTMVGVRPVAPPPPPPPPPEAVISKAEEVAAVKAPSVAESMYPVPAVLMVRSLKVATPLTA